MNRVNLNILSKLNVFNSSFELNQAKYLVYFCSHAGFGWVKNLVDTKETYKSN